MQAPPAHAADEQPSPLEQVAQRLGSSSYADYLSEHVHPASFLGVTIGGGAHEDLIAVLHDVETLLAPGFQQNGGRFAGHGIRDITGLQRGEHGFHSWGLAIDVNFGTSPYVMHEAGERQLDAQLAPVYHRIARFVLGRDSVIPREITSGSRSVQRTERLYDALAQESEAMRRYFEWMQDPEALRAYVESEPGHSNWQLAFELVSSAGFARVPDVDAIRRQQAADFRTLTGRAGPLLPASTPAAERTPLVPYEAPAAAPGDRPFATRSASSPRSPMQGFLDLRREIVVGLSRAGLRWGAIDFGPESGDVMHFDLGDGQLGRQIQVLRRDIRAATGRPGGSERGAAPAR